MATAWKKFIFVTAFLTRSDSKWLLCLALLKASDARPAAVPSADCGTTAYARHKVIPFLMGSIRISYMKNQTNKLRKMGRDSLSGQLLPGGTHSKMRAPIFLWR